MKYSRKQAKGRCKVHQDEPPLLVNDKLPRGVVTAICRAAVGTASKVSVHTRMKSVRRSVFDEKQADRRKNLKRWIENTQHSVIRTPENERRNMLRTAWKNVLRKEADAA
jgi:hypothetical protein